MQKILNFNKDKIKYISKPFDFECMCMINDNHNSKSGPISICKDAVDYLFEGTNATQDVINNLDISDRTGLCLKLWDFYVDALSNASKNE